MDESPDAPAVPLDGALDLHPFRPRDVPEVVDEFLRASRARGFARVRLIHGKGIGQIREQVHALLGRHPAVREFHLAGSASGGWGATVVHLRPEEEGAEKQETRNPKPENPGAESMR
jgi:DNA-nicking Smr family endonuclease